MKRIFYFTETTYQKGHCTDTAFFETAKEAMNAARNDWANLCKQDKKEETIAACICAVSDEKLQQVMEREGWESPETALCSCICSGDFLAFYSFEAQYEKTLLIADTINGVQEVSEFSDLENFTYVNDCFFEDSLKTLSDSEIIGTVADPEIISRISKVYGISRK